MGGARGTVLMLQAIPRSILMLFGGVASDRLRPRTVMLFSDLFRAVVVGTIAALTATDRITLPAVYALALLFGIVQAFFFPAASAITPELVDARLLRPASALTQMANQIGLVGRRKSSVNFSTTVSTTGTAHCTGTTSVISALFLL